MRFAFRIEAETTDFVEIHIRLLATVVKMAVDITPVPISNFAYEEFQEKTATIVGLLKQQKNILYYGG